MQLQFGINDEDAFYQTQGELLTELEEWLVGGRDRETPPAQTAQNASLLLDWRFGYSTGQLDRFTVVDINEFLLEWAPRKLSVPPEMWRAVIAGAEAWIEFLAATDRWAGGLVDPVLKRLDKIEPAFIDAMGDQSKFGMAKGLFMGPALAGADIDIDDPESLQAAMEAFNALPDEQRAALTDPLLSNFTAPLEPVEVMIGSGPDPVEVLAAAERAPIVAHVAATAEYLGAGKALTSTGNLKLADARRLLEIWETDDVADHHIGDREYKLRSAGELFHLNYLIHSAVKAGAFRKQRSRIEPVKAWAKRDLVEQIQALFEVLIDYGPVYSRSGGPYAQTEQLLDDALAHWMVPLLLDNTIDVDDLVAESIGVVAEHVTDGWWGDNTEYRDDNVARGVGYGLDVVERCGLVTRTGDRYEPDRFGERQHRRGGELTVTALGRYLLPALVEQHGYRITSTDSLVEVGATTLLDALDQLTEADVGQMWQRWWGDRPEADKVRAVLDAMLSARHPATRLNGLALLDFASPDAQMLVVELFETPLADHGAVFLLDKGLMDKEEAMDRLPHPPLGPMIDLLAVELDTDPALMMDHWAAITADGSDSVLDMIDLLWQVDLPETPEVLAAIGRLEPDKKVAKAARKAAFKARSRG